MFITDKATEDISNVNKEDKTAKSFDQSSNQSKYFIWMKKVCSVFNFLYFVFARNNLNKVSKKI